MEPECIMAVQFVTSCDRNWFYITLYLLYIVFLVTCVIKPVDGVHM